jgi:hypothetical protein
MVFGRSRSRLGASFATLSGAEATVKREEYVLRQPHESVERKAKISINVDPQSTECHRSGYHTISRV